MDAGRRVPANGRPTVVIDVFPEAVSQYDRGHTIVAVDVIRSTTMAVTAAAAGWRCIPVRTVEEAVDRAGTLREPLLAGELGGRVPHPFEMDNSPVALLQRDDAHRPLVLLSTSGTRVIRGGAPGQQVQVACLRNYRAAAASLVPQGAPVAVIGAGARNDFRDEDALCCAWIARELLGAGFVPGDPRTLELVEQWDHVPVSAVATGPSAEFLRSTGRDADLDFVVEHVDDLDGVAWLCGDEVRYQP